MSYIFNVDRETVWSPALQVGDLYVRFLQQIAESLQLPTGLRANGSDMYDIDIEPYELLIHRILDLNSASKHTVMRGLLEAVLAPSVVVLERSGRPIKPRSEQETELLDRAKELSMAK